MTFKQDFIIILTIFDVENRKMKETYKNILESCVIHKKCTLMKQDMIRDAFKLMNDHHK